jgi:hypothetical protein
MEAEPSGMNTSVRALADTFHERWLAANPFIASLYGITGYDDRVPDASLIGKREMLRLRGEAERRVGALFALPDFHAAVLDSGSLPMPVLDQKLRRWSAVQGSL